MKRKAAPTEKHKDEKKTVKQKLRKSRLLNNCGRRDLNPGPPAWQAGVLPD